MITTNEVFWRGAAIAAWLALAATAPLSAQHGPVFEVSFPASAHQGPITGRVLLFLATDSTPAPRFQGGALGSNGPVFGVDVSRLAPNAKRAWMAPRPDSRSQS